MKTRKWFKLLVAVMIASILIIGAGPALQRYNLIYVKKLVITGSGGLVLGDASGALDLNGKELTLDADADTSLTADTDDQIDVEIAGADDFVFTANKFESQTGSVIDLNGTKLEIDADADTSLTGDTDDQIDLEIGGSDIYTMTATNFHFNGKVLDLDVDIDTSITASTDDQIDIELAGADEYVFTAAVLDIGEGTLSRIDLDADGDTSLRSSADDQVEIEVGAADEFIFTAGILDIGNGTLGRIDLDADNDTSVRSSADDQIDLELGGSDIYTMTATNFHFNGKVLDLDVDIDTSITASTDDQIDVEIGGADEFIFTAGILDIGNGTLGRIDLDADNDTSLRSSADDQFDIELGGADQVVLKAVAAADSGATNEYTEVAFTTPVDTTGTNVHNALTVDLAIGNSTAGANAVTALQIDPITDDPQVVEKAINIGDEYDIAVDTVSPIVGTAQTWWDDFLGDTVLAQYTEVSGTDAEAVQAIQEEQFGVYQLTSGDVGNTAADLEGVYLSLEWQADQGSLIYETRLHLDTAITTVEVCAGFTDDVTTVELPFTNSADTVTAVADDAIMFCFDTGSTTVEWFVNGAAAGVEATGIAAAGVAPAQDVYQTLRIEIDDGGADCRFYIDGALVGTLTANCVTNTDLLAPGVVISSGGNAGSHVVDVDYIYAGAARD